MKISVFVKNTVVLCLTSVILRIAGVLFRIYLADRIGSEGMGVYQLIFSVYILASTFAMSGICTAVTRLVSENLDRGRQAVKHVMRAAAVLTLIAAAVSSAVVFFGAEFIGVRLLCDARTVPALKILCFSLPFMGLSSCIRGYFIACRKTLSPSLTGLAEQAVRIGVVLFCLSKGLNKGIAYSAAAVLLGDTTAETVSFLISWVLYRRDIRKMQGSGKVSGVFRKILRIALPLSAAAYMSTILHTAENLLIPSRLSGYHGTKGRGLELFGAIKGMAMPLLFFPASFLNSISTMLIPEVSQAAARGNRLEVKRTVERSVNITLSLSLIAAFIFLFFAYDIADIVYGDSDVGYILRVLSPIVPFMYLESVASGLLKGLDGQMKMLRYNFLDSAARIAAVLLLVPHTGISGYLMIMTVSNCFTSLMCLSKLKRASNAKIDVKCSVILPGCFCAVGGALGRSVADCTDEKLIGTIAGMAVLAAVFAVGMTFVRRAKKVRTVNTRLHEAGK